MDVSGLTEQERVILYEALRADRFDRKYDGNRLAALRWAVLVEKRRTVRTLISQVLVVKDEDGGKRIIPQLAFEVPAELTGLVYDLRSLAYVEQARQFAATDD